MSINDGPQLSQRVFPCLEVQKIQKKSYVIPYSFVMKMNYIFVNNIERETSLIFHKHVSSFYSCFHDHGMHVFCKELPASHTVFHKSRSLTK
jgi:hypothetical protein